MSQIGSNTQKSTNSDDTGKHFMFPLEKRPQSPAINTRDSASEEFMDLPTYMALNRQEKDFVSNREESMVELESPVGSLDGNTCINTTETEFESKVESSADSFQGSRVEELDKTDAIEGELTQQYTDRTGLKHIHVRPNDSDPYRGDAVLLIQSKNKKFTDVTAPDISELSSANHQNNNSEVQTNSEKHSGKKAETALRDTCTESPALIQGDGSIDILLINSSTTDRPNTNILPLDHRLSETPPRAEFLGKLKIMKRSSSLISDSGIESEPSSVVWPLDIRAGVTGSRDPLHLCRRRIHRNSLEGLQTESHGSLPSATQASLSSISSLPYEDEDEERQRQLNTLTKSASAPQISSPDNNNDPIIQDLANQGEVVLGVSSQKVECSNVLDKQEESNQEMLKEILCKQVESEDVDTGLISNSEVLLFHKFAKETPDEASDHEQVKHCGGVSHDENSSLPNENTGLCDAECCETEVSNMCNNPDSHSCDAISFHDIHLSELGNIYQSHENQINYNVLSQDSSKLSDLKEHPNNVKEQKGAEGHARTNQVPSSGLAFMNKKVVEVVNLSVSCAPTCLPFSSVLRDSPSVSGLSVRQANSPITHQPLGSFGIILSSSSSLSGEQQISERMLK